MREKYYKRKRGDHVVKRWISQLITSAKENLVLFLFLSLFFTALLIKGTDVLGTYFINRSIDHHIYTYHFSIGIFGVFLILPASILAVYSANGISTILKLAKKKRNTYQRKQNNFMRLKEEARTSGENYTPPKQGPKRRWGRLLFRGIYILLLYFIKLLYKMTNAFTKNIESSVSRSVYGWMRNIESTIDEGYQDRQRKKDAYWQANRKQKEADHAWQQAARQGNYNMNTHHFDHRVNEAKRKQREADRAKEEAHKM